MHFNRAGREGDGDSGTIEAFLHGFRQIDFQRSGVRVRGPEAGGELHGEIAEIRDHDFRLFALGGDDAAVGLDGVLQSLQSLGDVIAV